MAGLGRSNSLSINTSGGLFGNATSQGQQSAGLFGSSTNASQPQQTGGLFGSTTTQQTGGLFGGASTAQASQPPQSAGLFGNLNKPQATTGTTGGLFGASTTQSQPQQGASLFGGPLGGNTQSQPQTTQSGGLFGGLGQSQNQQAKPSLFGASTTQQNTTPSLFGNTTQQNQTAAPSLFGNTQQNQPQQTNSLFGGMASQSNPIGGLGQSTTLGNSQVLQMNDLSQIKGSHRVDQLAPDIQKQIYGFDELVNEKIKNINNVREAFPGHLQRLELIGPDVDFVDKKLSTVVQGIENDAANVSELEKLVTKDQADAKRAFRAIENQMLPNQFHYGNASRLSATKGPAATSSLDDDEDDPTKPVDLTPYFNRHTDELGQRLEEYQRYIHEIEAHLRGMEADTYQRTQEIMGARNKSPNPRQELVDTLKLIENAIVNAATKVGKVRDEVTQQTLGGVGSVLR